MLPPGGIHFSPTLIYLLYSRQTITQKKRKHNFITNLSYTQSVPDRRVPVRILRYGNDEFKRKLVVSQKGEQDPDKFKTSVAGMIVREDFECLWHKLSEEVMTGMKEWLLHPTLLRSLKMSPSDERMSGMRARMLEDLALASAKGI